MPGCFSSDPPQTGESRLTNLRTARTRGPVPDVSRSKAFRTIVPSANNAAAILEFAEVILASFLTKRADSNGTDAFDFGLEAMLLSDLYSDN